jgi:hypothetical protein
MYLTFQNANHPHQMLPDYPFPWLLCCYDFSETRYYEAINVVPVNCNVLPFTNCNVVASKDCNKTFIMEDYNETFIAPWLPQQGQDEGHNCLCTKTLMEFFFMCNFCPRF